MSDLLSRLAERGRGSADGAATVRPRLPSVFEGFTPPASRAESLEEAAPAGDAAPESGENAAGRRSRGERALPPKARPPEREASRPTPIPQPAVPAAQPVKAPASLSLDRSLENPRPLEAPGAPTPANRPRTAEPAPAASSEGGQKITWHPVRPQLPPEPVRSASRPPEPALPPASPTATAPRTANPATSAPRPNAPAGANTSAGREGAAAPQAPPRIEVRIGRLDVRVAAPAAKAATVTQQRPAARGPAALTLNEYLAQRRGG